MPPTTRNGITSKKSSENKKTSFVVVEPPADDPGIALIDDLFEGSPIDVLIKLSRHVPASGTKPDSNSE